jgi:purine-binding chemotaxis protein CheW
MPRPPQSGKRAKPAPRARRRRAPAAAQPTPPLPPAARRAPPAREPEFVFPDEPAARAPRVELPASGLASDILSRPDVSALAVAPAATLATPEEEASVPVSHNFSFFAAPQREDRALPEASEHLVTFLLAGEEYGIDVRLVQEIVRVSEITQVPRAPEFIKGVVNLRGRVIPVIDLKRRLGLGAVAPQDRSARIVVARVQERLVGLLVDAASQVLRVPVACIDPAPDEIVPIHEGYIRGVAKLEMRLVILMDLPRVLEAASAEASGTQEEP